MRLDLKNQYLVAANGQMLRLTPGQVAKIHKSFDRIRSTDQMIKKLRDSDKFEARLAARERDR